MKKIEVIIKSFKLGGVKEALVSIDVSGITVSDVRGYGRQQGHSGLYRGVEYVVDFSPKIKIEAIVKDDTVDEVIEIISEAAKTGKIGDGEIPVHDISKVVRIRAGETSDDAL